MNIDLAKYAVRSATGSVDTEATVEKFAADLDKFIAERETELSAVGAAVNAVFDEYRGKSINMPTVCSLAASKLNGQPANYSDLTEKAADFIRSHKDVFAVTKGKNGGVSRIADRPAPQAE